MTFDNNNGGFNSAAEYQASGLPWVTSSIASSTAQRWSLPRVTKNVVVKNTSTGSTNIAFGFTQNGVAGSNNFIIAPAATMVFETRVKEFWIKTSSGTAEYSIFAALTTILARNMPNISGSLPDGSAGWEGVG